MMSASRFQRVGRSSTTINTARSFSLLRPQQQAAPRAPALADVPADGVDTFEAHQREFREQLASEDITRKKKEQAESQYPSANGKLSAASTNGSPSQASSSDASSTDSYPNGSGAAPSPIISVLGSLSSKFAEEARAREESGKKKGPLSTLIYGTAEGRELDKDMERSFSQVLARGKYVHSIVFHEVKPDKVDEYVKLVGDWYPRVASMPENKVHLVGSWRTEVGDCDTFIHIWEYQRYQGYHQSLNAIQHHPDFHPFDDKLKTLIHSKRTSLMQEFSFWPTSPPRTLGGVFELRSYTLHPGNLLEWETHWRRGLKARREVMEGVGAWFVQIGELNTVHHLWQFANLEERKIRREQSWGIEGWGETVHKTVPLIQSMKSRVLVPLPWSPIA
ncbi:NIPSNAP-domain-containing protein [Trichodelitschia bisporula]|uniref:NIPSNAP-domain-containing protein n=1 Tax=Trichodelitschia bisporula TaxID=703511 RepID=A0A6G1HNC9_9PEZI|nr:NIPSNAP-domain-containing protein [Trichodelitschia bisporula]